MVTDGVTGALANKEETRISGSQARLSLVFSCAGHAISHLYAPIFFVTALSLERDFSLSHGATIDLIIIGNLLFGFAAPFAGWLGDRWSASGMMALFFLGTGGGMILVGAASTPSQIVAALAFTGLFASIYHPVGIAWLVRSAPAWGRALGLNGLFGGLGPAIATLTAGGLSETFGWRSAFLVPGAMVVATGFVFSLLRWRGQIVDLAEDVRQEAAASRQEMVRAFFLLTITMLCTGLIYQATQAGMPKMFSLRVMTHDQTNVFAVGALVSVIYLIAGLLQVVAGHLTDRFAMKHVYLICFALQVPVLMLAASLDGPPLVVMTMMMVVLNVGALPAENGLVARYSPKQRRGLAFGLKFILAFGISALAIKLEGALYDMTGGFSALLLVLGAAAGIGTVTVLFLPADRERSKSLPRAAPALPAMSGQG